MELEDKQLVVGMLTLPPTKTTYAGEELNKGKLTDVSGCDDKGEEVTEEVTEGATLALKALSEVFCNTENTKDQMLETDLNLEKYLQRHREGAHSVLCIQQ